MGTFKEAINWEEYLQMLSEFGASGSWEGIFKGITEVGKMVFMELEERCGGPDGSLDIVNTPLVFRFNAACRTGVEGASVDVDAGKISEKFLS